LKLKQKFTKIFLKLELNSKSVACVEIRK